MNARVEQQIEEEIDTGSVSVFCDIFATHASLGR